MKKYFVFFLIVLLTFVFFLLASCALENEKEKIIEESNHIHALAFDPTEPGKMYVATHYYLEKIDLITGEKERLGKYGNDYMGFVIASDGIFYSSGHSLDVANVGIRRSTDKGKMWETLAYQGSDFHDMAVTYADSKAMYAWSTPPEEFLTVSKNGGKNWEPVSEMQGIKGSIFALEADKQQPEKLYAGTLYGLFVSEDGGKNWVAEESQKNVPIIAISSDPKKEGKLTLATADKILQSQDNGKIWQDITGNFNQKEEVIIFLTTDPATGKIYGVTKYSKIYVFEDEKEQEWKKYSLGN